MSRGISIVPIDINKSDYGFKPDAASNQIYFGMKGLLNVGSDVINIIIENRPYTSFSNFLAKVSINKSAIISLIKSGAFDNFQERKYTMAEYIWRTCNKKRELNMRNMSGLLKLDLIPDELQHEKSVFEFNRYLKDQCQKADNTDCFVLTDRAIEFLDHNYDMTFGSNCLLNKKRWDKIYQSEMNNVRDYIKLHQQDLLYQMNKAVFYEDWLKYATGSYSSWEMEVMCFYYHPHELIDVDLKRYGLSNFYDLPEEPEVDRVFYKHGKEIPLYKLTRICGTCITKNKVKGDVTLLTTNGVVNVWFRKEYFALFDKQISVRQDDGTKHIIEKSWFNRGNMIIVTGYRRGDEFIPKKYASTVGHQLYKIVQVEKDNSLNIQSERAKGEAEDE